MPISRDYDICIIGGAGHVGLPLALVFARAGQRVLVYDLNQAAIDTIKSGTMPFIEYGAEPLLEAALRDGRLAFSSEAGDIARAGHVIVAVGTPVDEYLNPKLRALLDLFKSIRRHLDPGQTIIIRSTVFPRTCRHVLRLLAKDGGDWHVAYCPERIAQGHAIRELNELPQIVSGCSEEAVDRRGGALRADRAADHPARGRGGGAGEALHERVALHPVRGREPVLHDRAEHRRRLQPRAPGDGGRLRPRGQPAVRRLRRRPLSAERHHAAGRVQRERFSLGQAAMGINEGLPSFLVESLKRRYKLDETRVGILGMAFKADIDDIRDSLSYKLGKVLRFHGADVYYSDEFAKDPTFITKEQLVERSDVVIVGVPHSAYRTLVVPAALKSSTCGARSRCNREMKPIISPHVRIRHPEHFEIGEHSIVDDFCYFSTRVRIGLCSHIASGCSVAGGRRTSSRSAISAACRPA